MKRKLLLTLALVGLLAAIPLSRAGAATKSTGPVTAFAGAEEQIHTFGACNPSCTDLQISMHAAGRAAG